MIRLLVTLLLLSSFNSAQESHSAASATEPEAASDLPVWSTTLTQPNRYISAHGIRGFAGGYSEDGLEFWSFPLQLVSGYHLSFVLPKAPSISAISMLTSVEIDPLGVTMCVALSAVPSRATESKEARNRHVAGWPGSRNAGCARSCPEADATGSDVGIHGHVQTALPDARRTPPPPLTPHRERASGKALAFIRSRAELA